MIEPKCIHCGQIESDHCQGFEAVAKPKECVCDEGTWGKDTIPAVCAEYKGDGNTYCATCEHDKECHKQ